MLGRHDSERGVAMGFLKNLFRGGSPEKDMYRLLSGSSEEMANEMERIYRNQISIYQEECDDVHLSAKGILKARLFGATFMVFAFGEKWKDESALNVMTNASSGVAMKPFASPSYQPTIDRDVAASFAGSFMMDVIRAIASEMRDGPSTPMYRSAGFNALVRLYEDALKESLGEAAYYTSAVRERFFPQIAGAVNANLKHMVEWMEEL
jgi:hypothetical protein